MEIKGAVTAIMQEKQVSENFTVQEVYLDTSSYNNMTGEKYDNVNMVQVINKKVDVSGIELGDVVSVKCYVNGRFYNRQDGTKGFMQSLNAAKIERVKNTAGEFIKLPLEQLVEVNI